MSVQWIGTRKKVQFEDSNFTEIIKTQKTVLLQEKQKVNDSVIFEYGTGMIFKIFVA